MLKKLKAYLIRRKINRIKGDIMFNRLLFLNKDIPEELYRIREKKLVLQLNEAIDKWCYLTS